MPSRAVLLTLVLAASSTPLPTRAAAPQLVVLRFSGRDVGEGILDSATERASAAALRGARGRLKVVTRDMLAAIVGEEKLVKCETEARCELDLGTGLGTGYMLAGSIRPVAGRWEASIKLYDVRKLDLIAQTNATAGDSRDLLDRIEPIVTSAMEQAGMGAASTASGAAAVAAPPPAAPARGSPAGTYATFRTSLGDIVVKLLPEKAPRTVENFVGLAEGTKEWKDPRTGQTVRKPLYDGTVFHRVMPQFMIQGGDPLGNGTGGPGYRFADEIGPDNRFSRPGLLAMANSGPNTNGSQFFITEVATPWLDRGHTIFGEVVKGLDLVPKIVAAGPSKVRLEKVVITRGPPP